MLEGLLIGESSEEDVRKRFPNHERREAEYNGQPAILLMARHGKFGINVNQPLPEPLLGRAEFWLVEDEEGVLRLVGFMLRHLDPRETPLSDWLEKTVGSRPAATECGRVGCGLVRHPAESVRNAASVPPVAGRPCRSSAGSGHGALTSTRSSATSPSRTTSR